MGLLGEAAEEAGISSTGENVKADKDREFYLGECPAHAIE